MKVVLTRISQRGGHIGGTDVRLRSEQDARTAAASRRFLAPTADAVEQRAHRRYAGADGGDGELVAGPDGEIDVLPAGIEKGEFEEFGEADDADDAHANLP